MRILVIEDEIKLAMAIQESLEQKKYEVILANRLEDGFYQANTKNFDLILLDLNLAGRDGLELLTKLREDGNLTRVLILSARDSLEDRVSGLNIGADDYLVKPFAFPELHARIRALTRRDNKEIPINLHCADLKIDRRLRKVFRGNRSIELTPKEYDLLEYLLVNKHSIVSRSMLVQDVWGEPARVVPLDNVIDVHITHLRRKVDCPGESKLIKTVRGVGFILTDESQ